MNLATIPGNMTNKFQLKEAQSMNKKLMNLVEELLKAINIKRQAIDKDSVSCTAKWSTEPYGSVLITCTRTMVRGLCALLGMTFHQDAVGVCSSYTVDNDPVHSCFLVATSDGSRISNPGRTKRSVNARKRSIYEKKRWS
ncbi:unnamed protein product [Rotaria magnacalcarata]|uniref:Uncharacterized protein n=2 Tax=Rotaria magnacalcarata TaxID=392030 RepID=A0A8S2KL34_9BILA|nr:unnamed protein product [Rotaria magnacalcarata]